MRQFTPWARRVGGVLQLMDIPGHCTNLDALETDDDDAGLAFLWQMIYEQVDDRLRFTAPEVAKVIEHDEDADDELPHWIAEKVTRISNMGARTHRCDPGFGMRSASRSGTTNARSTASTGLRGTPARPAATSGPGAWKGSTECVRTPENQQILTGAFPPFPPFPPVPTGGIGGMRGMPGRKTPNPVVRTHFPQSMDYSPGSRP